MLLRPAEPADAMDVARVHVRAWQVAYRNLLPDEYLDEGALVGPVARIKERFRAWEDSGLTGLTVGSQDEEALTLIADLTGASKGNTA